MLHIALLYLFLAAGGLDIAHGAKILGIFPLPGKSHMNVHSALVTELANRGHEITVISPFPKKPPIPNYTDIDTSEVFDDILKVSGSSTVVDMKDITYFQMLMFMWGLGNVLCDVLLQAEPIQNLIHSKDMQFDLVIIEGACMDCLLGFAHKHKAPIIQVLTNVGMSYNGDWVGNPTPYSYVPDPMQDFTDQMTFYQRLLNTIGNTVQKLTRDVLLVPRQQEFMDKYFSDYAPLPSINELDSSTSLILVNSHFSTSYPTPLVPNMVQVGGMHIKPAQKLPEDLQNFLNEASDGVVYFSLGSNVRSADLPEDKINAFLEVFSKLKQQVLWKFETDALPGKPKNVKIGSWLPQSDILAHPNVRVFITHGGLLGTQETIHWGVPTVGIPFLADQKLNLARAVSAGYAVKLDYENITAESVSWALKEVLEVPSYRENAKRLSRIYRDQPLTPLETAVFWTEYVIRHKGAPHMRSAALDLAWYQYFLLDVIAVLTLTVGTVLLVVFLVTRAMLRKICGTMKEKTDLNTLRKKRD